MRTSVPRLAVWLLPWLAAVAVLARTGAFVTLPIQVLPVLISAGMAAPLVAYRRSAWFRGLVLSADIRVLTGFHVWRAPAALAFFAYGARGLLPATFVRNAAWGDLAVGVLAAIAVIALGREARRHVTAYTTFHVVSLADFVVAVGTGFVFSVGGDPLMQTLLTWPIALIPLFGVPVTGALSLLTLHRLTTRGA